MLRVSLSSIFPANRIVHLHRGDDGVRPGSRLHVHAAVHGPGPPGQMTLNFAEKTDAGLVDVHTCSCTCARLYVVTRTLNHSQNLVPEWGRDGEGDELWKLPVVTLSYLKLSVTQLDRNHGAGVRERRCVMFS